MALSKSVSKTSIRDSDSGLTAGVELLSGKNRLLTSAVVSIEQLFGKAPFANSWWRIENTGAENDTHTLTIQATTNDPSTPDRDIALYTKVFTILLAEVGDEIALRDRIIVELNADSVFKANFKAIKVKDNAIVYIASKFRGEFYDRPNVNDFTLVATGSGDVTVGFSDFIVRGKENELADSPDDPRIGVLGISGSLSVQPGAVSDRFEIELENGGSGQMAVDGTTPVAFNIPPSMLTATDDLFINEIIVHGLDNGIKLANFLGINSALTNGITFSIKADDETFSFARIKSTREIKRFATAGGWYLDIEAGGDDAMSIKELGLNPIPIRATGTFGTDDFFTATVNDALQSVDDLRVLLIGFKKEI